MTDTASTTRIDEALAAPQLTPDEMAKLNEAS